MAKIVDYIVVGSGCSGAMAAQTLIDAGKSVTMLDTGFTNSGSMPPRDKSLIELRKNDKDHYKYTIGEHGQGIVWGKISKGAQVTPPRQYITKNVDSLIPLKSSTFSPMESLSYGGLGIGWGLQCWRYSPKDLRKIGLNPDRVGSAYEVVAKRIGISATNDDAKVYTIGSLRSTQPSPKADKNHEYILNRYRHRKSYFKRKGLFVGRTPLALITQDLPNRKAYQYLETDFYSDPGLSAWRPWITVDSLRKSKLFNYIDQTLVTTFKEDSGIVTVTGINTRSGKRKVYHCKKLILASGALGTARIAMRSHGEKNTRVPLLSNPHTYIPCLQPKMLGKGYENNKLGFGQLSYFIDSVGNDSDLSVASSYSYQSLMLFRIINQIPLNFADAKIISRFIIPALVILIVQHPDTQSSKKYLKLVEDKKSPTGDRLEAHYMPSAQEEDVWDKREKKYVKSLRKLGTYPLRRVRTQHGSAIHYAGTLPFSDKPKPLHLDHSGRIHNTKHVYVADSSGFKFLPGKGLTFTLMANAHIVTSNILKEQIDE